MTSNQTHYQRLAAAFVRAQISSLCGLSDEDVVEFALETGLKIYTFKRSAELPRVRMALGMVRALMPGRLLDVGSGRGTFLWPLLDALPWLPVTSIEASAERYEQLAYVASGGVDQLTAIQGNACAMPFEDKSFDVVTILEVLEHLTDPSRAAAECLRVARRHVIASVPSKPDDNPEHIQLFTQSSLSEMFMDAGASTVKIEHVPGHMVALISAPS